MGNKQSNGRKSNNCSAEQFIIDFSREQQQNLQDISCLADKRRVVFVSLLGLFRSYQDCPAHILFPALFVLPLKRKWIYNPSKYVKELQSRFSGVGITRQGDDMIKQFIKLLQWKDSQGFAFWLLDGDEYTYDDKICHSDNSTVAPFWRYLSEKLETIYDAVNQQKLNGLNLDEEHWTTSDAQKKFKFATKSEDILNELSAMTMKYSTIQEIVYQSNPESLNPVTVYHGDVMGESESVKMDGHDQSDNDDINGDFENVDGFWISESYYDSDSDVEGNDNPDFVEEQEDGEFVAVL